MKNKPKIKRERDSICVNNTRSYTTDERIPTGKDQAHDLTYKLGNVPARASGRVSPWEQVRARCACVLVRRKTTRSLQIFALLILIHSLVFIAAKTQRTLMVSDVYYAPRVLIIFSLRLLENIG